jgi:hypothetical protein
MKFNSPEGNDNQKREFVVVGGLNVNGPWELELDLLIPTGAGVEMLWTGERSVIGIMMKSLLID